MSSRLSGVRALLLDLEGTVFQAGALIPGAAEALAEVERRGLAWRFNDREAGSRCSSWDLTRSRIATPRTFPLAREEFRVLGGDRV